MSKKEVRLVDVDDIKYIVVGNEAFDWMVEPEQVEKIQLQIKNDPEMKEGYIGSIFKHFVKCFSEFLGREVTLQEINEAIEKGYING